MKKEKPGHADDPRPSASGGSLDRAQWIARALAAAATRRGPDRKATTRKNGERDD